MARLLPVVAEQVRAAKLLDRDLRLAGAVRAHQGDVLAGLERAGRVEHRRTGRHGDHDLGRRAPRRRTRRRAPRGSPRRSRGAPGRRPRRPGRRRARRASAPSRRRSRRTRSRRTTSRPRGRACPPRARRPRPYGAPSPQPASRTAWSWPVSASESSTRPVTVGSPRAGLPGNDVTHLSRAWPPPSAGIARKSPAG